MGNTTIRQPLVTAQLLNAILPISNTAQRILLVGQKTAAGTAVEGELSTFTDIGDIGYENSLFGPSSMLAEMVRSVKRISPSLRMDAIPFDDASGTAAIYTMTFVGDAADESDTWKIWAGSSEQHSVDVTLTVGDTVAAVIAAIEAAVNADTEAPVQVSSTTADTVVLTAENKGTVGSRLPIGIATTNFNFAEMGLTAVITLTTPGATDPTTTSIFDAVDGLRYQGCVWPYPDDGEAEDEFETRWDITSEIMDGVVFTRKTDTYANLLTDLTDTPGFNSKVLIYGCDIPVPAVSVTANLSYFGPSIPEAEYTMSTYIAAIRALRLTDGESIGRFLTATASLDQRGGVALASLPYFNTLLPDAPLPVEGLGFSQAEIEGLYDAGGSVVGGNAGRDAVLLGEQVTTYLTDAASNADPTWKHLNAIDTASNIREYMVNNSRARFAQSRLTEGTVTQGRDQVNAAAIQQYMEQLYAELSGRDFVLTQSGDTALAFFRSNMTVTLDMVAGSATVTMIVPIVVQLRAVEMTIRIAFSTTGG